MQIHGEGPARPLKTLFDQRELVPGSSTITENMKNLSLRKDKVHSRRREAGEGRYFAKFPLLLSMP